MATLSRMCMECASDGTFQSFSPVEWQRVDGNRRCLSCTTGRKLFACGTCHRGFTTDVELAIHKECFHRRRGPTCSLCQRKVIVDRRKTVVLQTMNQDCNPLPVGKDVPTDLRLVKYALEQYKVKLHPLLPPESSPEPGMVTDNEKDKDDDDDQPYLEICRKCHVGWRTYLFMIMHDNDCQKLAMADATDMDAVVEAVRTTLISKQNAEWEKSVWWDMFHCICNRPGR